MMVIAERDAFLKREILSQQVRGGFLHPASLTCLVSSRVATIAKTRGATVVPRGEPKWVGALCSYEHSAPRNVPTRDSSDRSNKMTSRHREYLRDPTSTPNPRPLHLLYPTTYLLTPPWIHRSWRMETPKMSDKGKPKLKNKKLGSNSRKGGHLHPEAIRWYPRKRRPPSA